MSKDPEVVEFSSSIANLCNSVDKELRQARAELDACEEQIKQMRHLLGVFVELSKHDHIKEIKAITRPYYLQLLELSTSVIASRERELTKAASDANKRILAEVKVREKHALRLKLSTAKLVSKHSPLPEEQIEGQPNNR